MTALVSRIKKTADEIKVCQDGATLLKLRRRLDRLYVRYRQLTQGDLFS